ncbi:MAG: hypothetical protein RMN51_01670 [Verrucomicrobiota bacterium]|nr:hypothetical protein [Limisphaera sp.]MDW8380807.1 hypothetical protein [Verrucomicrobiota bacterium]
MGQGWQCISRAEYAELESRLGARVLWRDGIAWRRVKPFFWRPVFPYEVILPGAAVKPPFGKCSIYQHLVESAAVANTWVRYVVFRDVREYDIAQLGRSHRKHLQKGLEHFEIRPIEDYTRFVEEAWPVYVDFYLRTRYEYRRDRCRLGVFQKWAKPLFECPGVLVLGAFASTGLYGVDISYWVEQYVIAGPTFCRTEALPCRVSDALLHSLRETVARLNGVKAIWMGSVVRKHGINDFKLERGAVVEKMPAYCKMPSVFFKALKTLWPSVLERMGFQMILLNVCPWGCLAGGM